MSSKRTSTFSPETETLANFRRWPSTYQQKLKAQGEYPSYPNSHRSKISDLSVAQGSRQMTGEATQRDYLKHADVRRRPQSECGLRFLLERRRSSVLLGAGPPELPVASPFRCRCSGSTLPGRTLSGVTSSLGTPRPPACSLLSLRERQFAHPPHSADRSPWYGKIRRVSPSGCVRRGFASSAAHAYASSRHGTGIAGEREGWAEGRQDCLASAQRAFEAATSDFAHSWAGSSTVDAICHGSTSDQFEHAHERNPAHDLNQRELEMHAESVEACCTCGGLIQDDAEGTPGGIACTGTCRHRMCCNWCIVVDDRRGPRCRHCVDWRSSSAGTATQQCLTSAGKQLENGRILTDDPRLGRLGRLAAIAAHDRGRARGFGDLTSSARRSRLDSRRERSDFEPCSTMMSRRRSGSAGSATEPTADVLSEKGCLPQGLFGEKLHKLLSHNICPHEFGFEALCRSTKRVRFMEPFCSHDSGLSQEILDKGCTAVHFGLPKIRFDNE